MHLKKLEDQAESFLEKSTNITDFDKNYIIEAVKFVKTQKCLVKVLNNKVREKQPK